MIDLVPEKFTFMYADEDIHVLNEDFEDTSFPISLLESMLPPCPHPRVLVRIQTLPPLPSLGGPKVIPFIQDGMPITVQMHGTTPVLIKLPERATYTVTDTAPAMTSVADSQGTKPATLETGASITVPEHVSVGEKIVVTLADQKYVSKEAKKGPANI